MNKEKDPENEKPIIDAIDNGIVIDHIPPGEVWKVVKILRVDEYSDGKVSLGDGYESSQVIGGRKGILKIEGQYLSTEQLNTLALLSGENPGITVNFIKGGKITQKFHTEIPKILEDVVKCPNTNCVSNDEPQNIPSRVYYSLESGFRCHYCDRAFGREHLDLKIG